MGIYTNVLEYYKLTDTLSYMKITKGNINMKQTIKRIFKMNEVLVDVLVYLDSTKQSNTLIRSQVDTIVNFEKQLKEDSNIELESYQIKKRAGI